ncbi:hypothetical protein C8F01DRAFT_469316 [Mycena amicta]|nr:hypothetical protein C8F01DRAFT_469316 [Mycena amicta]
MLSRLVTRRRFGRWRGWIESRMHFQRIAALHVLKQLGSAAEHNTGRRERRRARGWGNDEMDALDPEPPTPTAVAGLTVQISGLQLSAISTLSEPPTRLSSITYLRSANLYNILISSSTTLARTHSMSRLQTTHWERRGAAVLDLFHCLEVSGTA